MSYSETAAGPCGILLNPNATDTDGDGLADGQELFVRTFLTSNRYPLPEDSSSNVWFLMARPPQAPAWVIRSVDLMTGFTHPDMAQASGSFGHMSSSTSFPYFVIDRAVEFRASGSNAGQANNFTSYDLLQKPSGPGSSWLVPSDFVTLSATAYGWFVSGKDQVADGKRGQLEYSRLQVTVRTIPNRADTDVDGFSDSEELNLASDGFQTDTWKADTNGDTLRTREISHERQG